MSTIVIGNIRFCGDVAAKEGSNMFGKIEETICVNGMMCHHCEQTVEKACAEAGAKGKADKDAKTVTVSYNPKKVSREAIVAAICEAGFEAK